MPLTRHPTAAQVDERVNVADRLHTFATRHPDQLAVVCPQKWSPSYRAQQRGTPPTNYATTTFAELDDEATRIARALVAWGVRPQTRLALLVRPGIEFVMLVFGLLRAGVTIILIDSGLGRRNMIRCLAEAKPEGFVAIPAAQAARLLFRRKFPEARWNVTVGRRWFWNGKTLDQLRTFGKTGAPSARRTISTPLPTTQGDDPAAIIFTSGSTGPPKGVLYTHQMFDTQVREIQSTYDIRDGEIDLACFPLFALFNSAMGVTTVLPEIDFSRPAAADPKRLVATANDWKVTQAFASPAVWRVVSDYCAETGARIPSLREVFSCGAPVTGDVQRATLASVADGARMHTPYGATECLPVSTIEAREVLGETSAKTDQGAGVCVGRRFESVEWRVIRISDDPIATIDEACELPTGEIGELIVRGPQASPAYVTGSQPTSAAKIADGDSVWHRMGDVGYFDDAGRFWYCGRKSQRVETSDRPSFTECVEAVFNTHPDIARTALVGLGDAGSQRPVLFFEQKSGTNRDEAELASELRAIGGRFPHTESITLFAEIDSLPVDIRHNAKIRREELAEMAEKMTLQQVAVPVSPM